MGIADFFKRGEWNFHCDLCGRKRKSGDGEKTWNNLWVCREHKERRNPQDFVRGVKDDQSVPWSRPEAPDQFVAMQYDRRVEDAVAVSDSVSFVLTPAAPSTSSILNTSLLNSGLLNG